MTQALEYVEIDVDYCSLIYGTSPCTAAIPGTGSKKCFNTLNTCQDRANFDNEPVTLRFALDTSYNPTNIEAIPNIMNVEVSPSVISLGGDLGIRSSVTITFKDHRHSDTGEGFDKYLVDRSYNPYTQGTFWARFRQRQLYLRGRALRLIRGTVGQSLAAMETRNYVIESFTGPSSSGVFKIVAKDVLKLADNDRAVAPAPSTGELNAAITNVATSATLAPSGIGNLEYAASGFVAIGGKEVCAFTRSGDALTLTRAQRNTEAQAHTASSRVQQVLVYSGDRASEIIADLLINHAGVDASYISTATWDAEVDAYLQQQFTAYIAEPAGVNQLVSELIEQAALALWWDDIEQELKLQVLRDVPKQSNAYDDSTMVNGSVSIEDQPNKRVSTAHVYYAQRNPLRPITDLDNYKALYVNTNVQNETDFGSASIKKVTSRWIPEFGSAIAERVSDILLARFADAPRKITFDLFKANGLILPELGGAYNVGHTFLQTDEGAPDSVPVQVISLQPGKTACRVVAEELRFTGVELDDPNARVITISSNTFNFNLRTIHDTLFPVITTVGSITVTVNIAAGVIVGSASTGAPAFDVGLWPNLPPITINNEGRIQGAGGAGGSRPSAAITSLTNGGAGGTALRTTVAITVDNSGAIYGGGGGGAARNAGIFGSLQAPAGSGGAGSVPGVAGTSFEGGVSNGNPGTTGAGGAAANTGFHQGGAGGGFGAAGGSASSISGTPGAAGNAIDGVSNITFTTAGTRAGPEIN